jgi:2-dehydropantoate 2-reductase
VGSVVGGLMARTGHEVSLLGRAAPLDVIQKQGLTITGIWGDYRMKAFELFRSAQAVEKAGIAYDLIILTVKAHDTEAAVKELARLMRPETMLLSLQNGLGNIETILKYVPADQYLVGRIIFGVESEPGSARVTVTADDTVIGPAPGGKPKLSAERMAHNLSLCKIPSRAVADILPVIWAKVIYNCALNPICSLHDIRYGQILDSPETVAEMEAVVRECYAVGLKKGIRLEPVDADAYLKLLKETLIPRTAGHHPSMLQDLRKGKRTDIESLNGAIVRLGEGVGIPAPANRRLTAAILAKIPA